MAADEQAQEQEEAPEIIVKPPSHPVTTTLLGTACVGLLLCIIFAWSELFSSYMPSSVVKGMENHKSSVEAKRPMPPTGVDHYAEDYPGKDSLWYEVGKDLKVVTSE